MRLLFCLILLLSCITVCSAQVRTIDSLIRELPRTTNDTVKARLYKSIVENAKMVSLPLAMKYAKEGLKHVKGMKWKKGIGVFYNLTGILYSDAGESYTKAIAYYRLAYDIHVANEDYYNATATLNSIGTAYFRQSAFDKAMEIYLEALTVAERLGNVSQQAQCLSNVATVYFEQNDLDKAMTNQQKALGLYRTANDNDGIALACLSIADTYQMKKDSTNAMKFYKQALAGYKQQGNETGVATVLTNMSILFGSNQKNLEYKLQAQEIWDRISPAHLISISNLGNIGLMYVDIARAKSMKQFSAQYVPQERTTLLAKAENYLNRARRLSKESGNKGSYIFLTGFIAELEAEKGDYKKAYETAKIYHERNDSLYSQESKNKIAAIEGQREVILRDKEIELNKQALAVQHQQQLALIVGVALLSLVGLLLYRQNRIRKKTNLQLLELNNELDKANKTKAKFFGILSHDLRSPIARLINFLHLQKEDPGLLTKEQVTHHQQSITTSAEALLDTMENILLWSKAQMENFKPSMKSIAVYELFQRLEQSYSFCDTATLSFEKTGDVSITSDENFVFTILQNLTANSIKALRGTPNATLKWTCSQAPNEIIISITDNGPGLDQSTIENLLMSGEVSSANTGFGFHIIRDLAGAIQCKISVESQVGSGTTFHLHFLK